MSTSTSLALTMAALDLKVQERIAIELMMSDRKLEASREGSK